VLDGILKQSLRNLLETRREDLYKINACNSRQCELLHYRTEERYWTGVQEMVQKSNIVCESKKIRI
jgi:hypothetical protein